MKTGELFLVTGRYGAGKTTAVRAALDAVFGLKPMKTNTTRPPRDEEIRDGSIEYDFVSDEKYDELEAIAGDRWDADPVCGYRYGANADNIIKILAGGISLIGCTLPNVTSIARQRRLYTLPSPTVVLVDTPLDVANERLWNSGDERRRRRIGDPLQTEQNIALVRQIADVVFKPENNLVADTARFVGRIEGIVHGSGLAS